MPKKRPKKKRIISKRRPQHQSAVLPVYKKKVFLVSTRRSGRWVIPKGVIEPKMTPQESAALEAWEEAGLKGKVKPREIGRYKYRKWGKTYRVRVYAMKVDKVKDSWKEKKHRRRKLVHPHHATRKVYPKSLKRIISDYFKANEKKKS